MTTAGLGVLDDRYLDELIEFLRIPSVSGDPACAPAMREAAGWLADRLAFVSGRVVATAGHPVVMAEWTKAPGAPTILVYGHYDVQPPGDETEWDSPPFVPDVREGLIYARGATDDKGPLLVPVNVAETLLAAEGRLPLNVRFLFEGEEEIGSPSLRSVLRDHRNAVAADLVVSADGAMWRPGEPSITIAARGMITLGIEVRGARSDLHSGRHGGAVRNPLHALVDCLASLHAPDGSVAVDGFYEGVRPLTETRRAAIAGIDFDANEYAAELGGAALHGEPGFSTLERLWARPTLEVNGVSGGGPYTVIPAVARAHISCRLVPDQDPAAVATAVERHVARSCPAGVTASVSVRPGSTPAYEISAESPAIAAAVHALRHVYPDREPVLVQMGGTLPAATLFEEELGLKTVFFSFSTADERLHAPNEFFRLSRFREGMLAWGELWRLLGRAV